MLRMGRVYLLAGASGSLSSASRQKSQPCEITFYEGLQAFLGKRSAGRRFQIAFELKRLFPVGEDNRCLEQPRREFGGVRTFAGVVSLESLIEVLREAGVETVGALLRLQDVHVVE